MKIFEFSVFGFTIAPTWYWLMYVLAFVYGYYALKKSKKLSEIELESLFFYIFLWVVLGGRIWYILFYNLWSYISTPLDIFKVWEWGMSFHGWLLWVLLAMLVFSQKYSFSFLRLADLLVKIVPVGLFFGRIGNYLNKELLGFSYSWPLAVQTSTGSYFPSPLVEAFLEWIIIFILLNYIHKASFPGKLWSLFLIYYWIFRTFVELFIRTPDEQIWYYFWFLTQWSLLSIPMICVWVFFYFFLQRKNASATK